VFIFYRIWLYYKTKNVEFKPGHTVEMNHLIQESPVSWAKELQTRKNITIWILTGYKPWWKHFMMIRIKD
jgi:hypothetical protein